MGMDLLGFLNSGAVQTLVGGLVNKPKESMDVKPVEPAKQDESFLKSDGALMYIGLGAIVLIMLMKKKR